MTAADAETLVPLEARDVAAGLGPREPDVFVDLTTTTHTQGRSAGATRVESRFAEALLRAHPGRVRPVSWSSAAGRLVAISGETAAQYVRAAAARPGEPPGVPLDVVVEPAATGEPRRVLLVTGSGWLSNVACLDGLLDARRRLRLELHVVLHDLVHALFPHWSPPEDSARFGSHLEAMVAHADRLLVYSQSTANDLARLCRERGLRRPDVRRIALGNEFAGVAAPDAAPSAAAAALTSEPFALYVSTVTFRKNHAMLCDVWARLAEEVGPALPRLVFAGRVAPDQEATLDRAMRHPILRDRLVVASQTTDAELAWLYARCRFTLFPSLYEGWGLPVAESLAFGKLCLASSASAVPEAAAGLAPVIDPRDFRGWVDAIRALITREDVLVEHEARIRASYRAVNWDAAAARLWDAVVVDPDEAARADLEAAWTAGAAGAAGTAGTADGAGALAPIVRERWRPVRSSRGAVVDHQTRFAFEPYRHWPHGTRLTIEFTRKTDAEMRVQVEANGRVTGAVVLGERDAMDQGRAGDAGVTIDVPADVLRSRALLDVVVTAGPPAAVAGDECAPPIELAAAFAAPLPADDAERARHGQRARWPADETRVFSTGSASIAMLDRGWGEPAPWGVWSTAPTAGLRFRPVPLPTGTMRVWFDVRAFVWPAHPTLEVDVRAGARTLATWTFRHGADSGIVQRQVDVPADALADGVAALTLSIPDCRSPRMLGMSEDDRLLGVGLVRARWTP